MGTGDWTQAVRAADAYFGVLAPHTDLLQLDRVADQTRGDGLALVSTTSAHLLTPQDETALRSQPEKHWVDIALANLYAPFAGFQLGAWRDDPFGLFGRWVQARAQETPVRPRDGRLFVGDGQGQYVLMPFTLRVPAFSMTAQQAVIPLLAEARQAARKAVPQVEVMAAGVILYAAAAGAQASQELSIIGLGSILGIIVLMWVTFHSLKPIALIMLSHWSRLPRRLVGVLVSVRAHPSADLSIRRQPHRRGPRLWNLFLVQSNLPGYSSTRFVAIAKALVAGIGIDAGHDGDRIYGPRADPISGLAANGGIFCAGVDIRMADGGLLVSRTAAHGHLPKRASGKLVHHQFGAVAVIASSSIGRFGWRGRSLFSLL